MDYPMLKERCGFKSRPGDKTLGSLTGRALKPISKFTQYLFILRDEERSFIAGSNPVPYPAIQSSA